MTAKLFKNGNSKAVRIPKDFLEDDVEIVEIYKRGKEIVITPKKGTLEELFNIIQKNKEITKGFMNNREQPLPQQREIF